MRLIIENGIFYIVENPDLALNQIGDRLKYNDRSAYPFGELNGEFIFGTPGSTHDSMKEPQKGGAINRSRLKYSGRFWDRDKVITFWEYPPYSKLKGILSSIERDWKKNGHGGKLNIFSFNIELPPEGGKTLKVGAYHYGSVVPISDVLNGKSYYEKEGGNVDTGIEHIKSPMEKKRAIDRMMKTKDGRKQLYNYYLDKGKLSSDELKMWKMIQRSTGIKEGNMKFVIEGDIWYLTEEDDINEIPPELQRLVQKHDEKQIKMGMEAEREHNKGVTDVVNSNLDLLKITLAHLEEDPEYYTHLKAMEDKYANEWKNMHEHLKRGIMQENVRITKRFTLDEESATLLEEAPHISVGDKTIDLEFEQGKLQGMKRVLNIVLGNQVTDKYGNKFKLEGVKEMKMFLAALARNAQIKSELK